MSYADVAASGPPQSPSEVHPPQSHTLINPPLTSCYRRKSPHATYLPHQVSNPRSAAPQIPEIIPTDRSVDSLVDVDTGVSTVHPDFQDQEIKTETQATRLEVDENARAEAERLNGEQADKEHQRNKAKRHAKKSGSGSGPIARGLSLDDPIATFNLAATLLAAVGLGFGAYRKHQHGGLTWKVAGMWSAGLAAVAGTEFVFSKWLYEKFPPKERK